MTIQIGSWTEDADFGDGQRGWFGAVGPWSLGVIEHPAERVTWGVSGPDANGEDLDADGVAPSVKEAKVLAIRETRRRWAAIGDAISRFETSTLSER